MSIVKSTDNDCSDAFHDAWRDGEDEGEMREKVSAVKWEGDERMFRVMRDHEA